jgi:DNA-binding beta-propeller fold protein YncE
VSTGKYYLNHPIRVAIVPFIGSNITDQSIKATSNATEDIGVEETNFLSSEEKNTVKLNNSNDNSNNNNDSESDNVSSSSENRSSKNNSTPGFGLLGGLTCLFGGWKLKKK